MHILMFTKGIYKGGSEIYMRNLAHQLAQKGHTIHLVILEKLESRYMPKEQNVRVYNVPIQSPGLGGLLKLLPKLRKCINNILARYHIDFSIASGIFTNLLSLYVKYKSKHKIKIVRIMHNVPFHRFRGRELRHIMYVYYGSKFLSIFLPMVVPFLLKFELSHSDEFVTDSKEAKAFTERIVGDKPIEVIPTGVDTARFVPPVDRRKSRLRLGLPDRPTVIYVGVVDQRKGLDLLLRAMAIVIRKMDATLIVCGDGPNLRRCRDLCRILSLENYVVFFGNVAHSELPNYYQAAEVFCLPSLAEGLPAALLEAMSSGVAPIVTPVGDIPFLIKDGDNGWLINEPHHMESWVKAILFALRNKEKRKAVARSALDTILSKYDWRIVVTKWEELVLK